MSDAPDPNPCGAIAPWWWSRRWWWVAVVVVVSIVLHFWRLGQRPLAHDEAIDAWFSWGVRDFGVATYDPVYHGPLRFYLEAIVFNVFGPGIAQARYVAAAAGVVTSGIIAASTTTLGRIGAPGAALVFTISPTILTVTRTGREDSLIVLLSTCIILLVARALTAPRPAHVIGLGVLMACSFGIKETTFILGLCALLFFVGGLLVAWRRRSGSAGAAVARLVGLGREPYLWALMAFGVAFAIVFTSGFRYSAGFASGIVDGISYWWGQHDVRRGGQPWFFYLAVYAAYEWLLVALAAVGALAAWRARSLIGAWFAWMAVSQLLIYAWAGEKFAWLAAHALVPAVLLAGMGIEAIGRRARRRSPRAIAGVAVGVVLAIVTTAVAIRPAVTDGADPRELLVTVQTSVDVPPVAERLRDAYEAGTIESIVVDDSGGGSWPWVWYLNGLPVSYRTIDQTDPLPDADVLIVLALAEPPATPDAAGVERIRLREWWVVDYGAMGVADAAKWFFTRDTWNPTGSTDQYVITRRPATRQEPGD